MMQNPGLERSAGGGQGEGCGWVWGNVANTVAGGALEVVGTAAGV